ncbi:hypothetical protein ACIPLA_22925 [Pseudomonas sp. NPDC086112]|uniref:hypothetical protein n=1 Tax=unclassified Pseudomonas TaxID=196821 RepID=UPI0017859369|nr:hypothetical protein [Pseudomonas sp. PDM09]MBD9563238.1 hypothetical protein [Pseudomonas sp. PDM09]
MNHEQQKLVFDLMFKRISKEKFIELFFVGRDIPEDYVCQELKAALAIKDADSVECLLIVGFIFGFSRECPDVLSRLLVEDWHVCHEDIASALQSLKYPGAVDYLFEAALADYPYIGSEYSLGVKCIHALHDVGTDSAKEKLRILAQAENPVLSELAGRLLASM